MKLLTACLLVAGLASSFAATCVTSTTQRGPDGPWVGEVTNRGPGVVSDSLVRGDVTDATGRTVSIAAPTCPTRLAPGESGTWEIFPVQYGLVPPLTGLFHAESTAVDLGVTAAGLKAELLGSDVNLKAIAVRITNQSRESVGGITVCGSERGPSGELLEVGNTYVNALALAPGDSITTAIYFASMSPGAAFDLRPQGGNGCCQLDPTSFRKVTSQISNAGFSDYPGIDRGITVVGEFRTPPDVVGDLVDVLMSAHIDGHALYRSDHITVGCAGAVKNGDAVPVMFTLPLPPGTDERRVKVIIDSFSARPSPASSLVRLPVRNVAREEYDVSGDIVNNTGKWVRVAGTCHNAREGNELRGTTSISTQYVLPPGAVQHVVGNVGYIGNPNVFEVVAYAEPLPGEPTPILAP